MVTHLKIVAIWVSFPATQIFCFGDSAEQLQRSVFQILKIVFNVSESLLYILWGRTTLTFAFLQFYCRLLLNCRYSFGALLHYCLHSRSSNLVTFKYFIEVWEKSFGRIEFDFFVLLCKVENPFNDNRNRTRETGITTAL